jgi:hypothetical protein
MPGVVLRRSAFRETRISLASKDAPSDIAAKNTTTTHMIHFLLNVPIT